MKRCIGFLCMISLAGGVSGQTAQKPVLAILNLTSQTVSQADTNSILGFVQEEFFNTQIYRLVERAQIEKLLKDARFQPSGICDAKCAADIGKQLMAQKVVNGTLSKLGDAYSIQLTMIDVTTSSIESMFSISEECPLGQLPRHISRLVNGLVSPGSRQLQPAFRAPEPRPKAEANPLPAIDQKEPVIFKKKSPFQAMAMSIIPGLGQYYNDQIFKGVLIDAVAITCLGVMGISATIDSKTAAAIVGVGALILIVDEAYSIIDAPISAASINKKHALKSAHMLTMPIDDDHSFGLDVGLVYKGLAAVLSFAF